jgi:hypothetical protein
VQGPTTSPSGDLIPTIRGGTREEPGTLTQGGALFSLVPLVWESNPKNSRGLVQGPTTSPSGDLIPTIRGLGTGWPRHISFLSLIFFNTLEETKGVISDFLTYVTYFL